MFKSGNIALVYVAVLVFLSCSRGGENSVMRSAKPLYDVDSVAELPLPAVPDSLRSPEERAAFLVEHFWDSLDFKKDDEALDTAFMEQSFSNFLSVLPYAPESTVAGAMGSLVARSNTRTAAGSLMWWIADKYLYDPNSPMRSESLYVLFLNGVLESSDSSEVHRERAGQRIAEAMKNRPGSTGADFRIVGRDGSVATFHEVLANDTTLVMFYDPDCTQCKKIGGEFAASAASRQFPVVAVDIAGDRRQWDLSCHDLPKEWGVWFAVDEVEDRELYLFPAIPSFYLFAPGAKVLLKDIPLSGLIQ